LIPDRRSFLKVESATADIVRTPKEGLAVSENDGIVVALTTELTDELVAEGLAREFVNKVQHLRKEMDLEITQRINIAFCSDDAVETAVGAHLGYIAGETLAVSCEKAGLEAGKSTELDLNGHACRVSITTAA